MERGRGIMNVTLLTFMSGRGVKEGREQQDAINWLVITCPGIESKQLSDRGTSSSSGATDPGASWGCCWVHCCPFKLTGQWYGASGY